MYFLNTIIATATLKHDQLCFNIQQLKKERKSEKCELKPKLIHITYTTRYFLCIHAHNDNCEKTTFVNHKQHKNVKNVLSHFEKVH